jgi:hypothetical protein
LDSTCPPSTDLEGQAFGTTADGRLQIGSQLYQLHPEIEL